MAGKPNSGLTQAKKKEYARELYIRDHMDQKDIALKVGVDPKTIGRWKKEENWDALKTTLLTAKKQSLKSLYDQLFMLNKENEAALSDDDPDTKPDYDRLAKLVASINRLESKTGLGEMIDTAQALIDFVKTEDLDAAKLINKWFDLFIKDRIASFDK